LLDLFVLFGGGRVQAVGFGVAGAVAVDGDASLQEFEGAVRFVAADLREGGEQQAEFVQVGAALDVVGVVVVAEVDQVGHDLVGGEVLDQVAAEEFEVAQVGVDGGDGALHALGDLAHGESLHAELLGLEDAGASGGVGVVGEGHGRALHGV